MTQTLAPAGPTRDYWSLYRKLEKTIREFESTGDPARLLATFLGALVTQYRVPLGIVGGRLYQREDSDYVLATTAGDSAEGTGAAPAGYRIPGTYAVIEKLRERGLVILDRDDPLFDPSIEGPLHVSTFAAITVGEDDAWIVSFSLAPDAHREHVLYALNTIRHVINWKLRQFDVEGEILRVQEIQRSLFPRTVPEFPGYDLWGRAEPCDAVGGDVFDFIPIGRRILGVLIADSSGHGLAAALHARDVVTGMRMGIEEDLKVVRVIEKLNRVIHRTSLSSKFVSLFYGELEQNGSFIYCNAGHVPTLRYRHGSFRLLGKGGPVLGPSPDASFERGFVSTRPGDLLVFYTDGIVEAHDAGGEEFGLRRLKQVIRAYHAAGARELVDAVFEAVERFAPDDPLQDDRTVVVVRRLPNA